MNPCSAEAIPLPDGAILDPQGAGGHVAGSVEESRSAVNCEQPRTESKIVPTRRRWRVAVALTVGVIVGGVSILCTRWLSSPHPAKGAARKTIETEAVRRAPMRIAVTARGTVDSSQSAVLASQVEWTSRIIELVPEGTRVEKGTVVCVLDSSLLVERMKERQIYLTRSEASVRQAEENLEIQKLANERNIAAAELRLQLAELDLNKFRDGEFPQQQMSLVSQITLARENLSRNQAVYDFTKRMSMKGYRSLDELEKVRIDVVKSRAELQAAQESEDVLEDFTYTRRITELEHNAREMRLRLERIKGQAEMALLQAEAHWNACQRSDLIHLDYAKRLQRNIDACTIRAPKAGEVVLANDDTRGTDNDAAIALGTEVRYLQSIVKLPDLSHMSVETPIHESDIADVATGMPAEIRIDALPDQVLAGRVTSVASVPMQSPSSQPELKEFKAVVEITEFPDGLSVLKPGLTAEVEIEVENRDKVLQVPSGAVVEVGGHLVSFVEGKGGFKERPVEVGQSDRFSVEIVSGLDEGERVVVSPRTYLASKLVALEKEAAPTALAAVGD